MAYSDSDYAGDVDDRKSTPGYVFVGYLSIDFTVAKINTHV